MRFPSFLTLALSLTLCLSLPSIVCAQINPSCPTELDGDGTVGMTDLLIVLADFGTVCEPDPPPPSSWPVLHFSELHYNPATAQGSDADFEFLELHNPHAYSVDLSGWSLSEGLVFTFPDGASIEPGEYLVVAANAVTYSGLGYPVFDWGSGGLHNSGELLAIRAPDGTVVESVVYSDTGDWDTAPDGQGPSLERLFLDGDPHDAGQWTASITTGGSPGAVNSVWVD